MKLYIKSAFKNTKLLNPLIFLKYLYLKVFFVKIFKEKLKDLIHDYGGNISESTVDLTKYLKVDQWVPEVLIRILKLELHNRKNLNILDVSTGFGYFPFMCNHLGHNAEATDIIDSEYNLYEKVTNILNLKKYHIKIEKFKAIELNKKYDLITSFMICFNQHKKPDLWHIEEWKFFLKDINKNLNNNGTLLLSFNQESLEEPINKDLIDYFYKLNADVNRTEIKFSKDSLELIKD